MKNTEAFRTVDDLRRSNGRLIARSYRQNVASDVALSSTLTASAAGIARS